MIMRQAIGSVEPSRELVMRRTRCGKATLDDDSAGTSRSANAPRAGVALALALAVAALPACDSSRQGASTDDRRASTTIGSGVGEATSDASDFELPMLDRPAPPRTLSTWLEVEIAGGRTWLNLDRVESITVPSTLNPVGRLPILVVHYGSGRKVELAFDDDTQRAEALRRIQATLTIARDPR